MRSKAIYAVRTNAFEYFDDPTYEIVTPEGMSDASILLTTNKNQAQRRLDELERNCFRALSGENLYMLVENWEHLTEQIEKLREYFKKHFPKTRFKQPQDHYFELKIPKAATDEQVDEIREMIPFQGNAIVEFDCEPNQFQVKVNQNFNTGKKTRYKKLPQCFLNRESAENFAVGEIIKLISNFDSGCWIFTIEGAPEGLSESPEILREVVNEMKWLEFETESKIQCKAICGEDIGWDFENAAITNQFKAFFQLMKEKTFVVSELAIDD